MKKILIINTVGYNYDGITSVILNYIRNMDRRDLSFVFPVFPDTPAALADSLSQFGAVEIVPHRKNAAKDYCMALNKLLKSRFDVIHIHGNSGTMLIEASLARIHGVKKVISHTHNTSTNYPFLNSILKKPMIACSHQLMACSDMAGKWLFGNKPFTVLNNAIDLSAYQYDQKKRDRYRREFKIEDGTFLIGHIGHFSHQKNHMFLIDVFHIYHKLEPNAKLLLISDGVLFDQIKEKVNHLSLSDHVIFAGRRSDAACIYSAMDMFVLPSVYEGLSLVAVEAQANGLPVLASDVLPPDTQCTDYIFYKSLSEGASEWAKKIHQIRDLNHKRDVDTTRDLVTHGFDIRSEADVLRNIYMR